MGLCGVGTIAGQRANPRALQLMDRVDHSRPCVTAIQIALVNTVVEALDRAQGSIRAVSLDHLTRERLDCRFTYQHCALSLSAVGAGRLVCKLLVPRLVPEWPRSSEGAIAARRPARRLLRGRAGPRREIPTGQEVLQLLKPPRRVEVRRQGSRLVVIADRDPAVRLLAESNDGRGVDKASSCGAQEEHWGLDSGECR